MAHLTAMSTDQLSLDSRVYGHDSVSSSGSSSNTSLAPGTTGGSFSGVAIPGGRTSVRNASCSSTGGGSFSLGLTPPASYGLQPTMDSTTPGGIGDMSGSKLAGLHGWLTGENRRVKSWWAARSGTDLHRLYMSQLQDTDGEFCCPFTSCARSPCSP